MKAIKAAKVIYRLNKSVLKYGFIKNATSILRYFLSLILNK